MVRRTRSINPPRLAAAILNHILPDGGTQTPLGDFEEYFREMAAEYGRFRAYLWYWGQVFNLLPRKIMHLTVWRTTMFRNYIKIALRNLKKHRGYSFINISGLAIGMACCLLILLWVQYQLSYNRFNEHADRIFRMYQHSSYAQDQVLLTDNLPGPLAKDLMDEFPEVVNATRFMIADSKPVKHGDVTHNELMILYADQAFLEMFSFPMIRGDRATALTEPHTIVLTQEMAVKYFGAEDPVGRTLTIDGSVDFRITGILEDPPQNSTMNYIEFIVPFETAEELLPGTFTTYNRNWPATYIQLHESASLEEFREKVRGYMHKHQGEATDLGVQPLTKIHLYTYTGEPADLIYVVIFTLVAFFVLLIACINFMNLSTARSENRAKEVGLRKVVGAYRSTLIGQFFGESVLMTLISLLLALVLAKIFLPLLNNLAGTQITVSMADSGSLLLMVLGVAILTGLIAGIYPALVLSAFQPVRVLKTNARSKTRGSIFRTLLVVFQFSITIFLIISTNIIKDQVDYLQNRDLGYHEENLVLAVMRGDSHERYEVFKEALRSSPLIVDVTSTTRPPLYGGDSTPNWDWDGKDPELQVLMNTIRVDYNYFDVMGMELAAGKNFVTRTTLTDSTMGEVILNEEAIRRMGLEDPVGKRFGFPGAPGVIIGIVKDFHFRSLSRPMEPMVIQANPAETRFVMIRIDGGNVSEAISTIESTWQRINPGLPLTHAFIDDQLDQFYRTEQRVGKLTRTFGVLSIFIACLGLFGLASFISQQRTKEIGIRKVLGASTTTIVGLLTGKFTRWVLLANLIAWPVAYFVMKSWLQDFAYRMSIGIGVFLMSGGLAFVIAMLTVSYQSVKAALNRPIDSIRYE